MGSAMTEKKIAAAKAAFSAALNKESSVYKKCDENRDAAMRRIMAPYRAACDATRKARTALTVLELQAYGITPMKTIVIKDRKGFVVQIKKDGYAHLTRVKKDNTRFKDGWVYPEYIGHMDRLTVTDRILTEPRE